MRIVVRCEDARVARDAQVKLAAAGYEAMALAGSVRSAPDGEDIVIAPAATPTEAQHFLQPNALANIIALPHAYPRAPGLDPAPGFTGVIALDASPALLTAQIGALVRLAIIEEERARREVTAQQMGAPSPKSLDYRKLKALYIGAPSPTFLAVERALSQTDGLVAAAFSSFAGFDHLHDDVFDAVILNGTNDAQTAVALCAALRRNASLYHLPTLVVTAPGDIATRNAVIERGASAVAVSTEPCGPSLGWLFEAIRRERRRRAAEHDMRALRDLMGDTRTGLFRRDAFDAHLARLAGDHHASGRPFSLVALRVLPAHGARLPSDTDWRRGFGEVASLAGRLMRETDCGAVIGSDVIAVALPTARLKAAKRTGERIASVAECTAFAAGEGGVGPLVFEQSSVELAPGESGAALLARALRALDVDALSA